MKKPRTAMTPPNKTDLAAYLGVTSSQLSMANSGRYSSRSLNDHASAKWTELNLIHQQQGGKGEPVLPDQIKPWLRGECEKLAVRSKVVAAYSQSHCKVLQDKLNIMREQEVIDKRWIKTLGFLLATLPNNKQHKGDRLWAQYQLDKSLARLKKNSIVAQAKLELTIELEKAKAVIYGKMERKMAKIKY